MLNCNNLMILNRAKHCHIMGIKPPGSSARNLQKEKPIQPTNIVGSKRQKQLSSFEPVIGLSANTRQEMQLDHQTIVGLSATNLRQNACQPITGLEAVSNILWILCLFMNVAFRCCVSSDYLTL